MLNILPGSVHTYIQSLCKTATLKKTKTIDFQDQLLLDAGQKYCRVFQLVEHFAIPSTFIQLPIVIKIFVFVFLEWPFYTGFTVHETILI